MPVTSDRFNSWSPAWSADGKWLWFLSDRELRTLVQGPWGTRQPDPFLTATAKIFGAALKKGLRSPFQPPDELHPEGQGREATTRTARTPKEKKKGEEKSKEAAEEEKPPKVEIDLDGLAERLVEVPVEAGNYDSLSANEDRLYWLESDPSFEEEPTSSLMTVAFGAGGEKPEVKTVAEEITDYQLSDDGKKLAVRKPKALYVFAAGDDAPDDLDSVKVDLAGWTFPIDPKEQWRQMFREAWRLERDYFYDPQDARRGLARHAGEVPAAVAAGDEPGRAQRSAGADGERAFGPAHLRPRRRPAQGGSRRRGGLAGSRAGARREGRRLPGGRDVYQLGSGPPRRGAAAGRSRRQGQDGRRRRSRSTACPCSPCRTPRLLLRNQAEQAGVAAGCTTARPATRATWWWSRSHRGRRTTCATPTGSSPAEKWWRRKGKSQIGYLHLRAMDSDDYTSWAMDFYPVFDRQGLILDLRNNRGGNIESWLLDKLQRKAWFWWQPRVGSPSPNMQYAFRGHLVVLVNESTSSDGEAFAEGVKRLGLGKVIGTRTWGGEIWLSSSNVLVDKGIATAAEFGVFGPEGTWLIEGHGVDPDVTVDNLPHATFLGERCPARRRHRLSSGGDQEKPRAAGQGAAVSEQVAAGAASSPLTCQGGSAWLMRSSLRTAVPGGWCRVGSDRLSRAC